MNLNLLYMHTEMVCTYLRQLSSTVIWWATTNSIRGNFQLKYLNCVVVTLIELEIWFPEADICYHNNITKLVKIVMWTLSKMWSPSVWWLVFPIHLLLWIIGNLISLTCDFTIYAHTHTHTLTYLQLSRERSCKQPFGGTSLRWRNQPIIPHKCERLSSRFCWSNQKCRHWPVSSESQVPSRRGEHSYWYESGKNFILNSQN